MKAVIDQISLNKLTLEYKMYLSFNGNQHVYPISHEEAKAIIQQGECKLSNHEHMTFWECQKDLGK